MSRKLQTKKTLTVHPGRYVWLSCEVKPGPFSDERMVRVSSVGAGEVWVGFASVSALKNPVESGSTAIKALVVGIQKDRFEAQPMGSALTQTLFKGELSKVECEELEGEIMSDTSHIAWTNATWNPVVGCRKVSAGCDGCYAIRDAQRLAGNPNQKVRDAYKGLTHRLNGNLNWTGIVRPLPDRLNQPLHWKKPRRVFVNSESDLFHEAIPDDFIEEVFAVMALASQHTFQILTKRSARMRDFLREQSGEGFQWAMIEGRAQRRYYERTGEDPALWLAVHGPLPNVWLGVSVENQATADERIPLLLQTPAAVRFVSYEPALEAVDFNKWLYPGDVIKCPACYHQHIDGADGEAFDRIPHHKHLCHGCKLVFENDVKSYGTDIARPALDWLIVGGESGLGARPFNISWASTVIQQCKEAGVACFYKQGGSSNRCEHDAKGSHMECFPEDLRIREFPDAIQEHRQATTVR
jgi:protein gp37